MTYDAESEALMTKESLKFISTASEFHHWISWIIISEMTVSRNRVQMQYRKSYRSNRESKQQTRAMIVLVERYCKTCMYLCLSTSRNDIYMYTRETFLDSSIIDSDLDLFILTNYLVGMMQAALRQQLITFLKQSRRLLQH